MWQLVNCLTFALGALKNILDNDVCTSEYEVQEHGPTLPLLLPQP